MYTFTKTRDKTNHHDVSNVTIDIPHNDVTLTELVPVFEEFLKACGFHWSENQHLDFVSEDE